MANNILLISGESGFMMQAIIRNLGDSNIHAELMGPSADKLDNAMSGLDNDIRMILMYAGEFINDSEDLFSIIRGLCEERGVLFSVIGYRRDLMNLSNRPTKVFVWSMSMGRSHWMKRFPTDTTS